MDIRLLDVGRKTEKFISLNVYEFATAEGFMRRILQKIFLLNFSNFQLIDSTIEINIVIKY